MTSYASTTTLEEIARRVLQADHLALFAHTKPDGDSIGSQLAIKRALDERGRRSTIFVSGPIEPSLLEIIAGTPYETLDKGDWPPGEPDAALVLDTGAWSQLAPPEPWLRKHRDRAMLIDHHSRGDDVCDLQVIDPDAPSNTFLVLSLLDAMGCPLTGGRASVAEALYVGMATDTGWFRYENAQASAFVAAARLLEAGVDKSRLYQLIEETHPVERLALEARGMASLEFAADGAVALMSLSGDDFAETGSSVQNLTGMVNLPMIARQVRVSILLAEVEQRQTKISFRAKPRLNDHLFMDVNQLAQRFGGGGHVLASGARIDAPLGEARNQVVQAVNGMLAESQPSPTASA